MNRKTEATKVLLYQFGLLMIIPLALLPLGVTISYSGLMGGAVAWFSALIMFFIIFRNYRAQQPERIVAYFYFAEMIKWVFTVAAFALIILQVKPINVTALLLVFFIIQVIPALLMNNR